MPTDISAVLTPTGRIIVTAPEAAAWVEKIKQVEFWHSPVDKGLALHFLEEASNVSKPIAPGAEPNELWVEAGGFLDQVGYRRPEKEAELVVAVFDEERLVLSLKLDPDADRPKPGLDGYVGLED